MSSSKIQNETTQYKNEFLRSALATEPAHRYWKNLDDGSSSQYIDSSIALGNTLDSGDILEETSNFSSKTDTQDLTQYLDEIQNIIQFYKINTVDDVVEPSPGFDTISEEIILSQRESEILYYLSLDKSIKDIAAVTTILDNRNVSASEINAIINKQLYPKFKVDNIAQLIETATALNLILFQLDS